MAHAVRRRPRVRPRVSPREICGQWHWYRFPSKYLGCPLSVSFHQCSTFIFTLELSPGQTGEASERSRGTAVTEVGHYWKEEYFHLVF
jgi:hypothetical protein